MRQYLFSSVAALAISAGTAFGGDSCGSKHTTAASTSKPDIVDVAVSAGSFKTLVTAVKAAGLVETLKGEGPFTVFAPTDEAFAKLPKGTVEALLKDKGKLRAILKYHVVPGKVLAADVVKLDSARTVLGQKVTISTADGVKVDGAKVVKTDIPASNGVIHVIDTVILPKDDIIDVARKAGSFKTLLTAIDAAGLEDAIRGGEALTVFAPTDDAFAKLPKGTVESLLQDKKKLAGILKYHVVAGTVTAADVVKLDSAKTLQGSTVAINASSGVKINNASVTKADVKAGNGVIHVIDSVLIPSEGSARAE